MYEKYSTAELAVRWTDKREIQNVMSTYASSFLLKRERGIYDRVWCGPGLTPVLGFNNGYYRGADAIKGYFDAVSANSDVSSGLLQDMFPKELGGKSLEDIHGVGEITIYPIVSGVIEIADDRQTAKGCWLNLGANTKMGPEGPVTWWEHGSMGADFVHENGRWRIWHLKFITDLNVPAGRSWAAEYEDFDALPGFEALRDLKLPEPNVPAALHEAFYPGRPYRALLPVPEPYLTFSETFSYGI